MHRSLFSHIVVEVIVAACLFALPGFGQTTTTGAIQGTIRDHTGAVVSATEVKVSNQSTGAQYQVKSQSDGTYVIPLLPPGKYRVSAAHQGFATVTQSDVLVNVTEKTVVDIHLQVGAVTSEVEVSSAPPIVQTDSSTLGEVVGQSTVQDTPLSTRNFTQIMNLSAGVASPVSNAAAVGRGTEAIGTDSEGEGTSVHGARNYDNSFQINGTNVNSSTGLGDIPVPNPDTIQEFKVQTGLYDAAYGRNAGANVNIITKTGTNNFHGSLFEFWRNDVLNANDYFFNRDHIAKPELKQNQFGGTIGGPIVKDKLLFFGSYQGTRQINAVEGRQSFLMPELTNDRSAAAIGSLFAGQKGLHYIFGPSGFGPPVAADGSNINPVALQLLQMKLPDGSYLYPTPNSANCNSPMSCSVTYTLPARFNENQYMANFDFIQSSKNTIQGRFFMATSDENNPFTPGAGNLAGQPVSTNGQSVTATLSDSFAFTPTLFNQFSYGFSRTVADIVPHSMFTMSQLGVTTSPQNDDLAFINILGSAVFGGGTESHTILNRFDLRDDVSWVHGKHNIRFGGNLLRSQNNSGNQRYWGQIQFPSWADFLLGMNGAENGTAGIPVFPPDGFSNELVSVSLLGVLAQPRRGWEAGLYLQDDLKLSSRLTLNLGVRYDWLPPESYTTGRATNIDPTLLNPNPPAGGTFAGFTVPANYPGTIPADVKQESYNSYVRGNGDHTFSPRLGFAYKLLPNSDRFVLRGGYGIYRSTIIGNSQAQSAPNQPWLDLAIFNPPYNGSASWAHPFPEPIPPVTAFPSFLNSYSPDTAISGNLSDPKLSLGMTQQYTLNLQTQVSSNLMLQIAYVGTNATDQLRSRSINQANLASAGSPIRGETTNTLDNVYLRVPYEGWAAGALNITESKGVSRYNGLEITARQRTSKGLEFLLSYTFSKTLGSDGADVNGSSAAGGGAIGNQYVDSARYGLVSFDRRHRFVASYIYTLPQLTSGPAFARAILNGWSTAGVTTFQTGTPLTMTYSNSDNVYGINSDRPSYAPGCTSAAISGSVTSRLDEYFNTNCFTTPAVIGDDGIATDFGNTGIGILRGPKQLNTDLSLIRQIKLHEKAGLEFRAEFFNLFNTPQFANPGTDFTSGNFGVINRTSVASRIGQLALKLTF